MIRNPAMSANNSTDATLVSATLRGNRDAFAQIISRYQSLICSLAYSATGRLGQSEDLAQETFITAWKHLRRLREPAKLRSWLCGIARNIINNSLRREGRNPLHAAKPIEAVDESPAAQALPAEEVISREEQEILWRSLEKIPNAYREPLVLFYREGQSVERVAEELELSEEAVKQRLSRGRKLLAAEVIVFVEGALQKSVPGKAFTVGVLAALPILTTSASAATIGASVVKGGGAKAAGVLGIGGAVLAPLIALFGTWLGYRVSLDTAQSNREREFVRSFYRKLTACMASFSIVFGLLMLNARSILKNSPSLFVSLLVAVGFGYLLAIVALSIWTSRMRRTLRAEGATEEGLEFVKPAFEYRSRFQLLGLPLVHVRMGGRGRSKPVKAWIAAGDCAFGVLFAFGGLAIAPVSLGGLAIGLLPFGGLAVGLLTLGGFGVGIWAFGGMALGWQAYGGCALAWRAAMGGMAIAREFALGGLVYASQMNNETAQAYIRAHLFFQGAEILIRYIAWLNLLWLAPMLLVWRRIVRTRSQAGH